MSLRAAIYSSLSSESTITSLVGTRIYPDFVPSDAAYPCITYRTLGFSQEYLVDGQSQTSNATVEFTLLGRSATDLETLAQTLQDHLSLISSTTVGDTTIRTAFQENTLSDYDFNADIFIQIINYNFMFDLS